MPRSLVGTRIREKRRRSGMTQTALAKAAGISASYLNLIEHNRRGIAGKTLLALARELGVSGSDLSEEADQTLLATLRELAAASLSAAPELSAAEELTGRFPGFARLIAELGDRIKAQDQNLMALSDRLNNDPYFAEAIHMMLTSITVIRSTSEILGLESGDGAARQKFLRNLVTESHRLSDTAHEVLTYFSDAATPADTQAAQNPVELFFQARAYHVSELEAGEMVTGTIENRKLADELSVYQAMADSLPLQEFLSAAQNLAFDPLALSAEFGQPLELIFRRLAFLPSAPDQPDFGLLRIDSSGAVLFRKSLPGLALPQYGSACPLWPVYRTLSSPASVTRCLLDMPAGDRFLTWSAASAAGSPQFGLPGLHNATMAFTADQNSFMPRPQLAALPKVEAGLTCPVCPRKSCDFRRTDYILA